ncbi:MAG: serine/threonine protein kinase [Bdellovibrionales bacterium]|nr:serine/threonine protein kinase [Bdellovibrionales bacterium]
MTSTWGSGPTQNFFDLTPDRVMNAIESQPILGELRRCTGYVQQLASFENRVYELEFEDRTRAVVKFYRPGRWTEAQIREEHEFMADILAAEVPVVVPHYFEKPDDTLRKSTDGLFYCLYPKVGGRQPEDLSREKLQQLGRLIARMHTVGVQKQSHHRIKLVPESYGEASLQFLLDERFVSVQVERRFKAVVREIISVSKERFQGQPLQRIHGDCHAGNILWNEKLGPFFIDFDDMVVGPPIQDLWLLAPDPEALQDIIDGYVQMRDLPQGSVAMVECLRALRMIHYATWVAKRYNDPAFKRAFPQFESPRYWEELTYDLEKQMDRILGPVGGGRAKDEDEFEGFWDDED